MRGLQGSATLAYELFYSQGHRKGWFTSLNFWVSFYNCNNLQAVFTEYRRGVSVGTLGPRESE